MNEEEQHVEERNIHGAQSTSTTSLPDFLLNQSSSVDTYITSLFLSTGDSVSLGGSNVRIRRWSVNAEVVMNMTM